MSDSGTVMAAMMSQLQALEGLVSGNSSPAASGTGQAGSSFLDTLKDAVTRVDGQVASSESNAQRFTAGDQNVSLSDVMVSLEQANLAFQTAATVRDKIVNAYQTIMNMQL